MTKIGNQNRLKVADSYTIAELNAAVTRTATVAGATTGTLAATDVVVNAVGVTGQTAYILLLPAPVVGKRILFLASPFAYTIKTSGATIKINGAGSAAAVLTVAAWTVIELVCTTATNWVVTRGGGAVA